VNAFVRHFAEKKAPLQIAVIGNGLADSSTVNGSDKTVTQAGACFDETALARRITEGLAERINGGIETVFEIDMQAGPEFFGEFLARDESAWLTQEKLKDAKGLVLERNTDTRLTEFAQLQIKFERREMNYSGGHTSLEKLLTFS
jgi:hypothetical protein